MIQTRRFTLIEIFTAMVIFSLLSVFVIQILNGVQNILTRISRNQDVVDELNTIVRIVTIDLKGIAASGIERERIYVDGFGVGARDIAFVTTNIRNNPGSSGLMEIGYEHTGTSLKRWETSDLDGSKFNFLNTYPETWAADNSWGLTKTIAQGVKEFTIDFYQSSGSAPFYAPYDTVADSDVAPAFARISISLVHPRSLEQTPAVQKRTRQTYEGWVNLLRD